MFCVECGAEGEVHDGLCQDCFIKKGRFVEIPKYVDIQICAHCDAIRMGTRWEKVEDVLERAIEDALQVEKGVDITWKMDVEEEDERNFRVHLDLKVDTRGFEFPLERDTRVRVKVGSCRDCSRKRGSYYEAIVQIRATKRDPGPTEIDGSLATAEDIVAQSGSFITKVSEEKGGTDIYLGKTSDGRALSQQLATRFGGTTTETKSQAGRKDGVDIFRSTFLVRLPSFKKGDLVLHEGSMWEIRGFTKNKVGLEDISSGNKRSYPTKEVEKLPIFDRGERLKEAVVVSEGDHELQVMDPDSYKTVDVKRPPGYTGGKKDVKVVSYDGTIYLYMIE